MKKNPNRSDRAIFGNILKINTRFVHMKKTFFSTVLFTHSDYFLGIKTTYKEVKWVYFLFFFW